MTPEQREKLIAELQRMSAVNAHAKMILDNVVSLLLEYLEGKPVEFEVIRSLMGTYDHRCEDLRHANRSVFTQLLNEVLR